MEATQHADKTDSQATRKAAEYEACFGQQVHLDEAEAQEVVTEEDMEAEVEALYAKTRREMVEKVLARVSAGGVEEKERLTQADMVDEAWARQAAIYKMWFNEQVQRGLDTLKAGRAFGAKQVEAAFEAFGKEIFLTMLAEAKQFICETPEYDACFRQQVQIGLDEAVAGNVLTHEEAEAEMAAFRKELRQKRATKARRMADEVDLDAASAG